MLFVKYYQLELNELILQIDFKYHAETLYKI